MSLNGTLTRRAALGAAAAVAGCAHAKPLSSSEVAGTRSYVLPGSDVLPMTSQFNGVDYALYVRPPHAAPEDGARPPLIVTLDADYQFAVAANHLEHLAARMNQAPAAVLVSIAYAGQYPDKERYRFDRTRDYTPVHFPTGGYGSVYQKNSGGGPNFLSAIEKEIIPLIEKRYGADPEDRTLVGHSYGGLFAAWALQTRPEVFNRYLLVSPSLWYAEKMILKREAAGNAARLPRKTRVYMGVGSWEEQPENGVVMVSDLEQFAGQLVLRGDSNLVVKHRIFEDETHASIFPAAFSTGVRHLFLTM